jgi:predicted nucleic acid-binding protein
MVLYADTSLLVSYYVADANSARAQALIHASAVPLVFTGLHRLELRNALALGIFRGLITRTQAQTAGSDMERDCRAGRLLPTAVNWVPIFRAAAQLAIHHSPSIGSRSLDVLHVSTAKRLGAAEFWSFDARQAALATAVGLTVKS